MTSTQSILRFGPFRLDPAKYLLISGQERIHLQPKVFKFLLHLIANENRVVSRDELLDAVWGTEHLSAGVVAQVVLQLRQALGDTGESQQYIETVRGFGYRWKARLQVDEAVDAEHSPKARASGHGPEASSAMPGPAAETTVAVMLPVIVRSSPEDRWVRLGIMDFINERLRSAGLSMVSSETVIAFMAGREHLEAQGIDALRASAGAQIVLGAEVFKHAGLWTVYLRTVTGVEPALTTAGEAYDVIEAARAAVTRLAEVLGLPSAEPGSQSAEPLAIRLSRQVYAALLVGETGNGRSLLAKAPPEILQHPEIQFSAGQIEVTEGHVEVAQATFERLLDVKETSQLPAFHGRVLHALSFVQMLRNDWEAAQRLQMQALELVGDAPVPPAWTGAAERNAACMAIRDGDFASARRHLTRAIWVFHQHGQLLNLATVDYNAGLLEAMQGQPGRALRYFRNALERYATFGKRDMAARVRAELLTARLELLDLEGAAALAVGLVEEAASMPSASESAILVNESLAMLELALGRPNRAKAQLQEVLQTLGNTSGADWRLERSTSSLAGLAEAELDDGDFAAAEVWAHRALEQTSQRTELRTLFPARCRAGLALARAHIGRGAYAAAQTAAADLVELASRADGTGYSIRALLAHAEVAGAQGEREAAAACYEQAMAEAEPTQSASFLLEVAHSYCGWLLNPPRAQSMLGRALELVYLTRPFAMRWYRAALIQLQVYHAMGDRTAWRIALEQTRALAGERSLPAPLQVTPRRR